MGPLVSPRINPQVVSLSFRAPPPECRRFSSGTRDLGAARNLALNRLTPEASKLPRERRAHRISRGVAGLVFLSLEESFHLAPGGVAAFGSAAGFGAQEGQGEISRGAEKHGGARNDRPDIYEADWVTSEASIAPLGRKNIKSREP
jgi:hypothetical protein